jgi:hypothetical protein
MIPTPRAEQGMGLRTAAIVATMAAALAGCDGKDPDRLNRVGKKLVEKGQKVSDEAHLPRVKVEMPEEEKTQNAEEKKSGNGERKTEN